MKKIEQLALSLAAKWYNAENLQHAVRVADYALIMAKNDVTLDDDEEAIVYAIAILHDILEDTDCPVSDVDNVFYGWNGYQASAVELLTKEKDVQYNEYMEKILSSNNKYAILVKRADLKDHMSQTDTLTPKLIEKYIPYIGKFM